MGKDAGQQAEIRAIVDAALRGVLTEALARRALALGGDAALTVMLAANRHIAEQARHLVGNIPRAGPHTPSGAIPPYAKGVNKSKRPGRPGARKGHAGHRRAAPIPDRVENLDELKVCPACHSAVGGLLYALLAEVRASKWRSMQPNWPAPSGNRILATSRSSRVCKAIRHRAGRCRLRK